MKHRSIAGAALAETAVAMSFVLLLLFGTIQIALVGFYQMQLDGATFMFSHEYATGSTNLSTLGTDLGPIFPAVPMNLSPTSANPPDTNEPVNFTQWGTLTERFGGAAVIRPDLISTQAQITVRNLSMLGNAVTLSAGNVEGESYVGNHDDDAQGAGYNSQTVYNSLVNPLTGDDQNVPPYYFTLAFMSYCPTFQFGSSCFDSELRSLGLAEYLKDDNYNTTNDGIGTNGTFQTMACHQRIYADLANAFPATMPAPARPSGSNWDETSSGPSSVAAYGGASFQLVYDWDIMPVPGSNGGNLGRSHPLNVTDGCSAGGPGS